MATLIEQTSLNWRSVLPAPHPLRSVPVSWMGDEPDRLEVAGLGGYGTLHWAAFSERDGGLDLFATNVATADDGGYLARPSSAPA